MSMDMIDQIGQPLPSSQSGFASRSHSCLRDPVRQLHYLTFAVGVSFVHAMEKIA
jgi:hypothetical protein